jgi:dinuclear metal center YbgI/SA1388 family protein
MSSITTAGWVIEQMETWASLDLAEEWDNVGLLIGDELQPVKKILVALDLTDDVLNEAITNDCDFVICHHPPLFTPINRIVATDSVGRKIIGLIRNGIGLYCAHTNLDKATGGVNDCLAKALHFATCGALINENKNEPIEPPNESSADVGFGRVVHFDEPIRLIELVEHVKKSLNLPTIRYAGDSETLVTTVGLCAGSASDPRFLEAAKKQGCQAYITGDLRYHVVQGALDMGLSLIDVTHYSGEVLVVPAIAKYLRNKIETEKIKSEILIFESSVDGQVFKAL